MIHLSFTIGDRQNTESRVCRAFSLIDFGLKSRYRRWYRKCDQNRNWFTVVSFFWVEATNWGKLTQWCSCWVRLRLSDIGVLP